MSEPQRSGALPRRKVAALALTVAALFATTSVFAGSASADPAPNAGGAASATSTAGVHGLKGEYSLTGPGFELGTPTATVLDTQIDYRNLVPVFAERTGQGENAGVSWTGTITAPETGDYTFSAIGDNGMRLWVDGTQLIDHWVNDWEVEQTAKPFSMTKGEAVEFRFDMFQATGGANMHLSWAGPNLAKSIVPLSAFAPPADFEVYPAVASVPPSGETVNIALPGAVTGAEAAADHVKVSVDQTGFPIESVAVAPDGRGLVVTPGGPIQKGTSVRVAYDGLGGVTVDGVAVPAFDVPVTNTSTYVLTTPWADDVDPANPLPEYPRPQLAREAWQNLNGQWQFADFAKTDRLPFGKDLDEKVVVPFPIESQLSGVERHEDSMVYRRTFEVPKDWKRNDKNRVQLNFGAVDYSTTVYVNARKVATHVGGYDSFSADITDALNKKGANEIVVRVDDTTGNQPRGKQDPNPSGIFYTPSSGIWQTVWLEPVQSAHIDRLKMTPDLTTSSLKVTAVSASASSKSKVEVLVRDHDGVIVGSATGAANQQLTVPISELHLWTPDDPFLYDVTATMKGGGTSDTVTSYQGMRSISIGDVGGQKKILLNGKPTFLLSTLDQGYWPDGVYTAPTDEALAWDISTTKELGFNTIRKHIKVEPARWYYHADQIGMLVWQDMPANNGGNADRATQDSFRAQLKTMIDQHDSFTSIIGWIPFNEGWGEWNRDVTGEIADNVKAQDPSRLVNAHSGVNCCNSKGDSGRGDIIDWHQYTGPALPKPDARRAAIDGEHGGFSYSAPGHVWPGGSVNPYGEVATPAELTAAYVANTNALVGPASTYLSGSVYTQLTDVEGEVNGFYTYDRRIEKMDRAAVRAANLAVIAAGSR
ncbi:PA14 domain-containing protein [Frigoribacterium sp. 2-23]|uniref:PA14 domain-containing protein n=1 Tax=Frigoribacterium sp. 2-23 TaxID=3415006 RepID=UPI003C6F811A